MPDTRTTDAAAAASNGPPFSEIRALLRDAARQAELTQRRIVDLQTEKKGAKELRLFLAGEAATFLGLAEAELKTLLKDCPEFPKGRARPGGRRAFSLEEIRRMPPLLRDGPDGGRQRRGREGGESLQVLAVANFKGGAAKTTTAVHLAQYLALRGYRVLLVDLDSQGSLTSLFGLQPEIDVGGSETLYPLFRGEITTISSLVRETHWPGLDLVPAALELYQAEFELPVRQREAGFRFWRVLEEGILASKLPHDVVILDCPPSLGFLSINALFAATGILVPAPPSMIDFASTAAFFRMTEDVLQQIERYDTAPKTYAFFKTLVTKFDLVDQNHRAIAAIMAGTFGAMLLEKNMPTTTMLDAAGLRKQTFYEVDPATPGLSRKTRLRAFQFLNALNRDIETLLWRAWGRSEAPPPAGGDGVHPGSP